MRAVIQRVLSASVEVDGEVVSSIGPGLLCLIGVKESDGDKELEYISRKILKCRAWPHPENGKAWDVDVVTAGHEVLLVSQFTLYARFGKNKPDYSKAMKPQPAKELYARLVDRVKREYKPERVKDGIFGAYMQVKLQNDGPVTYILDTETD